MIHIDAHFELPVLAQGLAISAIFTNTFLDEDKWPLEDLVAFAEGASRLANDTAMRHNMLRMQGQQVPQQDTMRLTAMVHASEGAKRAHAMRSTVKSILLDVQAHIDETTPISDTPLND